MAVAASLSGRRWDCEALARNEIRWTRASSFGARRELSEDAIELGGEPTQPAAVFLASSSGTRAARNGLPLDHAPRRLAAVTPPSPFRLSIGGGSPTLNIEPTSRLEAMRLLVPDALGLLVGSAVTLPVEWVTYSLPEAGLHTARSLHPTGRPCGVAQIDRGGPSSRARGF